LCILRCLLELQMPDSYIVLNFPPNPGLKRTNFSRVRFFPNSLISWFSRAIF
jgi:hypothetical protein